LFGTYKTIGGKSGKYAYLTYFICVFQ